MGVLSPKTGYDSLGLSCERGAKVAEVLLRGLNLPIEIVYGDTESSPEKGSLKAEKLINEGAHLLIGAQNSNVTAAIAQVCERRGIPFLINISAASGITEQGYRYVFRNYPTTEQLAKNGLSLMGELFKQAPVTPKTAALMYASTLYGQSLRESIMRLISNANLPFKIIEEVAFNERTRDLSSEIAHIKAAKVDLLIPIVSINPATQMIRECVKQHYCPMGIIGPGSTGMHEGLFCKSLGRHANYCMSNTPWHNSLSPLTQKAMTVFKKKYPNDHFDLNIAFAIEAVLIAADAFKRAGSTDGDRLRLALKETYIANRIVYGGPISFDYKGQAIGIDSVCVQNHQGNPVVVLSVGHYESAPVFPMPAWST
ncbi:MAG: ABC transporter substrate-binding protein [Alphaproteobacteria bacterium]|nr:ABC transporter substrate-binding protein [Alphaproteobacteria bacterium]